MKTQRYFTLVEFLIIISIIFVLIVLGVINFRSFQKEFILENAAEEIINVLKLAQSKTLASEGASQWGVYFETSTSPHQYILFQGSTFQSRTTSSDEIQQLPFSVEFSEINLGEKSEVVFNRISGIVDQPGSVSLRLINDLSKTKKIYIENSGLVGLKIFPSPSDENRLKDSRHVHFNYNRDISTSSEKLVLTFTFDSSTTVKEINLAENIKDGQIFWEGEIDVGGEIQKIKIHTHYLNDPVFKTQFCIHRDRRYNNKAFTLDINDIPDPDPGTLISFDSEGQTQQGTSIYVSEPILQ